ncbi:MAG TPA: Na+/H+ antiporter subunit E [Thermomicrobiales bacterium]|nr:Na+/H+ antiporter subunit E [Thermomicrobiales bacterium]
MILVIGILASSVLLFGLMTADFTWQNLVLGFAISIGLLWGFRKQVIPRPLPPSGFALHLVIYAPVLFWYLLIDILKGTWVVSLTTLGIRPLQKPGIVTLPIGHHSPYGVGPVGYFVTLSPGSFLVEVDWDAREMLVHVIDASNPDAVRRDAEKYYRLWEYGNYAPRELPGSDREEGEPHA